MAMRKTLDFPRKSHDFTSRVEVATKLTDRMEYPSHFDERFASAPIGYQSANCPKVMVWVYSDRLKQLDYTKDEEARKQASLLSNNASNDPLWHKTYLEAYYPGATLWAIRAGYNLSSGHPYWVYGFTQAEKELDQ
jgi:hypothetical protein